VNRTVSPELLDSLPADSAAARQSRRDLRWFNRLLGNDRWWRRQLPALQSVGRGLELGAGDGALAGEFGLDAIDLQAAPANWNPQLIWHSTDIADFEAWADYPLIVANLFLHHFRTTQLAELGARLNASARIIVANEPWRAPGFRAGFSLLGWAIRAHEVSRHDGRVSVEAGFRGDELPTLLRLDPNVWQWQICRTPLGMYRMIARKGTTP
jgi:hypothetical protein